MPHIDPQWCLGFLMACLAAIGHLRLERNRAEAKEDRKKIAQLDKELDEVKTRLMVVENERDSLKSDLESCTEKRIELLEENRELRKENSSLVKSMAAFGDRLAANA